MSELLTPTTASLELPSPESTLSSLFEQLAPEPNPAAQWLRNYLHYVKSGDSGAPWFMQTPRNIAEELQHWNGWRRQAAEQRQEPEPDADDLSAHDILPVSYQLLQLIVAQMRIDSRDYHQQILVHENLRAAAHTECALQIAIQGAGDLQLIESPLLATPIWELLHNPVFAQYPEAGVGYYEFQDVAGDPLDPVKKCGFAVYEPASTDPDYEGPLPIHYTYLFYNLNLGRVVFDTMQQYRPANHITPLLDFTAEEFFPLLVVDGERDARKLNGEDEEYPVLAEPWRPSRTNGKP